MTFFESLPQPPVPEPPRQSRRRPWMRPETVIPGSVPDEVLLVRTETVAVAVGSLRAYPSGFEFTVHVRLRRTEENFGRRANESLSWHAAMSGAAASDQALRLGIMYADGRRTATTSRLPAPHDAPGADELVLIRGSGSGSARQWDGNFWLYPLPPDGPVTFVVSWLAHGVTEARAEVDGSAIRAAATRAIELWPDDPADEPTVAWASGSFTATRSTGPSPASPPADPTPQGTDTT